MKKITFIIVIVFVILNTGISQEKVIESAVMVIHSENPKSEPGTIRFTPTTCDFESWNDLF